MKDPKLVRQYRVLDVDLANYQDKLGGSRRNEASLFIPTKANQRLMQSELDALLVRQQELPAPDEVFSIIKDHMGDFINGLQLSLNDAFSAPSSRIAAMGRVFSGMRNDTRPALERKTHMENRFGQFAAFFEAVIELLPELPTAELNALHSRTATACTVLEIDKPNVPTILEDLSAADLSELQQHMEAFQKDTVGGWIAKLEETIAARGEVASQAVRSETDTAMIDAAVYRKALEAHGVDLDYMLSWYEADVEKTRSECFRIANALATTTKPVTSMAEVNDILLKYAGAAASPEEMFERATEYVIRCTAAAHEFIWLPDDSVCLPTAMHKSMKASYPWGHGGSTNLNLRPFNGRFGLNDENYMAITDGWIKINCCHEVHPGHYTQQLRNHLDPLPEVFKRGAKSTCMTEAMCVRTEKLFEFVFAEDPYYPLFTAYRRHHTSVRIMIDLWLRVFGKTIGDVVDLYVKELAFDRVTARKQVQAHENDLGYFTTYYYGYRKVAEWEKLYGFDKREYTELLFSLSRTSLETFERYLKLSDDDRYALTHEFGSLIQFK